MTIRLVMDLKICLMKILSQLQEVAALHFMMMVPADAIIPAVVKAIGHHDAIIN